MGKTIKLVAHQVGICDKIEEKLDVLIAGVYHCDGCKKKKLCTYHEKVLNGIFNKAKEELIGIKTVQDLEEKKKFKNFKDKVKKNID